ncbi:MAG: hypothetical protein MK102_19350 [Fuerstiella sp.]|nr:hypothetical protein [Fuerstiella sp.]
MRLLLTAFAATCCLTTYGCQSARYVVREQEAGVVAIPSNSSQWPVKYREHAEELMSQHFPEGYEIVREEEVVVGQQTHFQQDHQGTNDTSQDALELLSGSSSGTSTTLDQTEWRIHYRRKS